MCVQAAQRCSARLAWLACNNNIRASSFTATAVAHDIKSPVPRARPPAAQPSAPRRGGPSAVAPQHWVEVVDEASGQIYFWNKTTGHDFMPRSIACCKTAFSLGVRLEAPFSQRYGPSFHVDETTALGEPRPGPEGRRVQPAFGAETQTSWTGLVAMGAGVGLVFAVLGRLL